jgi:hypothetical protein
MGPVQDVLWHIDPLLGNGREISNYTTAGAEYPSLKFGLFFLRFSKHVLE